jgi:hypothetical protein
MSFHRHRNQGASVSNAEHTAKDPSNRIGLFAVLSDLPRDGGSGAGSEGGIGGRTSSLRLVGLLTLVFAALLALAASSASAATTRQLQAQITEADSAAPPAEFGSEGPGAGQINEPRGIAVDNEDSVYVADTALSSETD